MPLNFLPSYLTLCFPAPLPLPQGSSNGSTVVVLYVNDVYGASARTRQQVTIMAPPIPDADPEVAAQVIQTNVSTLLEGTFLFSSLRFMPREGLIVRPIRFIPI